mmetsp:Transcript_40078/g.126533  ORF Transcript_40078/g.126533 Transcript_40078/m.126533 type:complete len:274 (-) Transcript_40078:564-1385(-)
MPPRAHLAAARKQSGSSTRARTSSIGSAKHLHRERERTIFCPSWPATIGQQSATRTQLLGSRKHEHRPLDHFAEFVLRSRAAPRAEPWLAGGEGGEECHAPPSPRESPSQLASVPEPSAASPSSSSSACSCVSRRSSARLARSLACSAARPCRCADRRLSEESSVGCSYGSVAGSLPEGPDGAPGRPASSIKSGRRSAAVDCASVSVIASSSCSCRANSDPSRGVGGRIGAAAGSGEVEEEGRGSLAARTWTASCSTRARFVEHTGHAMACAA